MSFGGGFGGGLSAGAFGAGGGFSGGRGSREPPPLHRTRSGFFDETNEDDDENFWNQDSDTFSSPETRMAQVQRLQEMQRQQMAHYASQMMMQRAQMLGG